LHGSHAFRGSEIAKNTSRRRAHDAPHKRRANECHDLERTIPDTNLSVSLLASAIARMRLTSWTAISARSASDDLALGWATRRQRGVSDARASPRSFAGARARAA